MIWVIGGVRILQSYDGARASFDVLAERVAGCRGAFGEGETTRKTAVAVISSWGTLECVGCGG